MLNIKRHNKQSYIRKFFTLAGIIFLAGLIFSNVVLAYTFPARDSMSGNGTVGSMSPTPPAGSYNGTVYDTVYRGGLSVNTFNQDLINRRENFIKMAWTDNSSTKTFRIFNGMRNAAECIRSRHGGVNDANPNCDNIRVRWEIYTSDNVPCASFTPRELGVYNAWSGSITIPQSCFSSNADGLGLFSVILRGYFWNPNNNSSVNMPGCVGCSTGIQYFKGYQVDASATVGLVKVGFAGTTSRADLGYPMAIHNDIANIAGPPGSINPGWWNTNPSPQSTYHVDMTVGCNIPTGSALRLRWEDADRAGALPVGPASDQRINFRVTITRNNVVVGSFDTSTYPGISSDPEFIGGSQSTRYVVFDGGIHYGHRLPAMNVEPGDLINWVWSDVRYANNLTVSLFYDQITLTQPVQCRPTVSDTVDPYFEPGEIATFDRTIGQPNGTTGEGSFSVTRTVTQPSGLVTTTTPTSGYLYRSVNNVWVFGPYDTAWNQTNGDANNTVNTTGMPIGTRVCEIITASVPNGAANNTATNATETNPNGTCFIVISRPVVKFYKGDIRTCKAGSGIYTWATNSPSYRGSSVEYAAIAKDIIDASLARHGFYSHSEAQPGTNLTFANQPINAGTWGGNYQGVSDCVEYYNSPSSPTPGPQTYGNIPISPGTHDIRYVNGDVFINGDIYYTNTNSWSSRNQIPSFELIVNGNIYIKGRTAGSPAVTQLDGFYYATGNIYTCSSGLGDNTFNNEYTQCQDTLNVTGAMYARESIKLWRTTPTLNTMGLGGSAAEIFNYSPEITIGRGGGPYEDSYDSMQSLPPIF